MAKKFELNFPKAISEFESALKTFQLQKVVYRRLFRAKGLEFNSYRKFEPDDDAALIDWKASLRANDLLAREYIEEGDKEIYFILDVSNSMLFGSNKKLKSEYAAEMFAALAHLILTSRDKVGLIMFSNNLVKIIRPGNGLKHFFILSKFVSNPELYGGGMDLEQALLEVFKLVQSSYAAVIIISDFIHIKTNFARILRMISLKYETIALMVRDKFDEELPNIAQQLVIQDPYSKKQLVIDQKLVSKRYNENALRQKQKMEKIFQESGVDYLDLKIDKSFVIPLVAFLKSRAREAIA